ncbi:hypothetical protein C2G38_2059797 [Gigaspora rosea]|uniref:Uncharacterized protein n=1 Tax=Gigaspora rosea TaxID=44941 RepID=A0A397W0J5_9GLOM|nr:hypothetical protein C2G38_2059797 [Gigaspora rosea]
MAYLSFFPFCVLTALFAYPTLLLIAFCPMYLCTSSFPIATTFFCCLISKDSSISDIFMQKRYFIRALMYLSFINQCLYTFLTFNEMGDIPFTCPQNYTYETSELRLACNIRLTNLLCMLVFPILCVLYAMSVWILISCSKRTGQKCEFKSVRFLKLYKNALFSDHGYSRILDEDDDDDDIDFEENRVVFDEEEEFIKAELDNFKLNSNLDLA